MKRLILFPFLLSISSYAASVNILQFEDFEGVDFSNYTLTDSNGTSRLFVSGASDFINRTSSTTADGYFGQAVSGFTGSFIAFEDLDGDVGFPSEESFLTLSSLSGEFTDLGIGFTIAAPDATANRYEVTDLIELQYRVDGGSWISATDTTYSGNATSAGLFNGSSNVTTAATAVFADLTGVTATTSFQVRARFISGTQEEMVFDDIIVRGDAVPEPSSSLLVALSGMLLFVRRRK